MKATANAKEVKEIFAFGAEMTALDDRMIETGVIVMTILKITMVYELSGEFGVFAGSARRKLRKT